MRTRVLIGTLESNPSFACDDRIFLGEGLFETIRVVDGAPCFAELHWQRMCSSTYKIGIPFDLSLDEWLNHLGQHIKRDNLYQGGIKAILSGGSATRGLAEYGQMSQLMLHTFNYSLKSRPLRLLPADWERDAANPVYQYKSINYLEAICARRQALARGVDDVLFFNTQQHATETTCSNVFFISNEALYTAPVHDGVLPGITRARILSLCAQQGIPCFEQSITKPFIEEAEAAFTVNALQGIQKIESFDTRTFDIQNSLVDQLIAVLDH